MFLKMANYIFMLKNYGIESCSDLFLLYINNMASISKPPFYRKNSDSSNFIIVCFYPVKNFFIIKFANFSGNKPQTSKQINYSKM